MWNTDSLWVEITVVSFFFLIGNIYFGHFEERSPKWRKLVKFILAAFIIVVLSVYFGRIVAFCILGLTLIPVIYIHAVILPRKGINGWTGEPKSRYYEFRGWSKDIFGEGDKK